MRSTYILVKKILILFHKHKKTFEKQKFSIIIPMLIAKTQLIYFISSHLCHQFELNQTIYLLCHPRSHQALRFDLKNNFGFSLSFLEAVSYLRLTNFAHSADMKHKGLWLNWKSIDNWANRQLLLFARLKSIHLDNCLYFSLPLLSVKSPKLWSQKEVEKEGEK